MASLWKVPDRETRQLMERFYRNRWDKNMSPLEACTRPSCGYPRRANRDRGRRRRPAKFYARRPAGIGKDPGRPALAALLGRVCAERRLAMKPGALQPPAKAFAI